MGGESKMGKLIKISDKLNYKDNSESKQIKETRTKINVIPFKGFFCDMSNKKVSIATPYTSWDVTEGETIGYLTEAELIMLDNLDIYFPVVSDIVLNYEEMVLELYKIPVLPERRPVICAKVPIYIESIYGDNHSVDTFKNIGRDTSVYKRKIDIENEKIWLFDNLNQCIAYVNIQIYDYVKETYKNIINEIKKV